MFDGGVQPDDELIARAAAALAAGAIVCMPTETSYGLAVDASNGASLERLSTLKGRTDQHAFGLIVPDLAAASSLVAAWPDAAEQLAARHWPGPLTIVLPARRGLHRALVGVEGGVGMRVSSHPWAARLARAFGGAITATSANPVGAPPATDATSARSYFGDAVAVYLDAGPSGDSMASTVVLVQSGGDGGTSLRVLRKGAVELL